MCVHVCLECLHLFAVWSPTCANSSVWVCSECAFESKTLHKLYTHTHTQKDCRKPAFTNSHMHTTPTHTNTHVEKQQWGFTQKMAQFSICAVLQSHLCTDVNINIKQQHKPHFPSAFNCVHNSQYFRCALSFLEVVMFTFKALLSPW